MEPPMSTGPQAGRQQGGQWEADQERFLAHSKQSFLELDLYNSFLFVDFFSSFLPVLARDEQGRSGARLGRGRGTRHQGALIVERQQKPRRGAALDLNLRGGQRMLGKHER